jgi:predicted enzyme related to lactoylglutathione lyase
MHLGYITIYVANVPKTVVFYETAFALKRPFVHESSLYEEMEKGGITLAFSGIAAARMTGLAIWPNDPKQVAAGWEVCLLTDDVAAAYQHAVAKGLQPGHTTNRKTLGLDSLLCA